MNKIYRVVWNATTGEWVVASEVAKGRKKKSSQQKGLAMAVSAAVLSAVTMLPAHASSISNSNCTPTNAGSGTWSNVAGCTTDAGAPGSLHNLGETVIGSYGFVPTDISFASMFGMGGQVRSTFGSGLGASTYVGANASNSIALGTGSVATEANTVSLGRVGDNPLAGTWAAKAGTDTSGQDVIGVDGAVGALDKRIDGITTEIAPKLKYIKFGLTSALDASANGVDAVAIGGLAQANGDGALAIGPNSRAQATNAVAIGAGSSTTAANTFAVGSATLKRRIVNVADGTAINDAVTVGQMNTKIAEALSGGGLKSGGGMLMASGNPLSAPSGLLGATSRLTPDQLIVSGPVTLSTPTDAIGQNAIAMGLNAHANANNAVAAGQNVSVLGANGVAVGQNIAVGGISATAIGSTVSAVSDNAVAIGSDGTEVNTGAPGAVAIGRAVSVGGAGTIGIGSNIIAATKNSVVLGADSSDDNRDNTVSVGSSAVPGMGTSLVRRQIINVAAGTKDTDAVNVSQLKGVTTALGGGTAVNADGTIKAPTYTIQNAPTNDVGTALSKLDTAVTNISITGSKYFQANSTAAAAQATSPESVAIGGGAKAVGAASIAMGNNAQNVTGSNNSIAIGGDSKSSDKSVTIGNGADTSTQVWSTAVGTNAKSTGQFGVALGAGTSVTGNNAAAIGANSIADRANSLSVGTISAQRQIINVAAGTQDHDAVNVSQLKGVTAAIGGGSTVDASGNVTQPSYTVDNKSVIGVGEAIKALDAKAVPGNPLAVAYDSATKDKITLAGTAGTTIANVTAGAVTSTSKDAINGSQLFGTASSVAAALGGGSTVDANGGVTKPTYKVDSKDAIGVDGAVTALDGLRRRFHQGRGDLRWCQRHGAGEHRRRSHRNGQPRRCERRSDRFAA